MYYRIMLPSKCLVKFLGSGSNLAKSLNLKYMLVTQFINH